MKQSIKTNILIFILSILIVLLDNMFNSKSFDILHIINLFKDNIVILIFIISISYLSIYYYEKDLSYKQRSKNKISIHIFRFMSRYLHVSTVVIAINSILIDNFLNMEFHDNINYLFFGISLSSISMALFISAKISLGKNYSPCFSQRTPSNITSNGLYKYVRHPIYTANVLLLSGTLIISCSYLIIFNILPLTFFYVLSAFREEKYLINKFPHYRKYSKKTGMFIPKYWK